MVRRLDIHPGEGIGPIKLGMQPGEVLAVFPEPQVFEDWMGGNLNDALVFHGLRLQFYPCDSSGPLPDSRLYGIAIYEREGAYLFNRPVGTWSKDSILEQLRQSHIDIRTPPNGDVDVPGQIGFGFDDNGQLSWVEVPP